MAMKELKIKIIVAISILVFSFAPSLVFANEYYYQNVDVAITINQDSTFDVMEKQIYYLEGSFGFFNRDLSTNKTDAITDVEILDENNNAVPKSELDIRSTFGTKHIQWNFPRRDFLNENKGWTIKYKVHGGISFLKNYDEIYWNAVPSERGVVIKNVAVKIQLQNGEKFDSSLMRLYAEDIPNPINGPSTENTKSNNSFYFANSSGGRYFANGGKEAVFWGRNLQPNTNFTVAAGFSKGIVDQGAYWRDFFAIYYGYILSLLVFLATVIYSFYYWYKTEKSREGKRSIIPEYEPPQNLRPAMAEVIVKEKLTDKGLSATIIDLAVRGYVKIEEEKPGKLYEYVLIIVALIFFLLVFTVPEIRNFDSIVFMLAIIFILSLVGKFSVQTNYLVKKIKDYKEDPGLEDYERQYLNALFDSRDYFSTKETKNDPSRSQELYKKMIKVKDRVYKETETDTKAFEIGLTAEKTKNIIWGVLAIFGMFFTFLLVGVFPVNIMQQFTFLVFIVIVSFIGLYSFIKYEARLSDEGIKLKEDWLGFKMYLEMAEKYRMQNLKPEYFEKYLPYAIIFGVEKKWAKEFESLNLPQPSWYAGSAYVSGGHVSGSSFSPSAFSASFASSFSSSISSSGASGVSGGGGGAGGGGGGGGGGAG